MNKEKQQRLENAGWTIGTSADFLKLSKEEEQKIEKRIEDHRTNIETQKSHDINANRFKYSAAILDSYSLDECFIKLIKSALEKFSMKKDAAEALGITVHSLKRKIIKYGINYTLKVKKL